MIHYIPFSWIKIIWGAISEQIGIELHDKQGIEGIFNLPKAQ